MDKADFNRVLRITLAALTFGFITSLVVVLLQQSKTQYLTLAAGASSGESFILGNALKKVVERHLSSGSPYRSGNRRNDRKSAHAGGRPCATGRYAV
jgi:hypothetical protein